MKLESGKHYINGRGDALGPMLEETRLGLFQDQHGCWYHHNGHQWNHHPESTGNIVAESPSGEQAVKRRAKSLVKQPMCVRCKFFQPSNSFPGHGDCRASPPQPLGVRYGGGGFEGLWPMVYDSDWCGEYVLRRALHGKWDGAK